MGDHRTDPGAWVLRSHVDQQALYNLLECAMDIVLAFDGMAKDGRSQSVPHAQLAARRISVALRKVLLSGGQGLLRRCIERPALHLLARPATDVPPVKFIRNFDEQSLILTFDDGESVPLTVPAHDHTTVVYPLPGVEHVAGREFRVMSPIDTTSPPVRLKRWLNTRVLQVDEVVLTAEEVLRLLANREGAHHDENLLMVSPVPIDIDSAQKFALASAVTFGGLAYPHLFSLFVGLYLISQVKCILDQLPFPPDHPSIAAMRETIKNGPTTLASASATIENASQPLVVLGHDRTLQGDYSRGLTTTMRMP